MVDPFSILLKDQALNAYHAVLSLKSANSRHGVGVIGTYRPALALSES
jgi:hypothetical protein